MIKTKTNIINNDNLAENLPRKKNIWEELLGNFIDCAKYALITFVVCFFVTRFFAPIAFVPSSSMEPAIPTGSICVCLKTDYFFGNTPERGDIVLFSRDENTGDAKTYVKRIVGLPGDTVEIVDGETFINDEKYEETWLAETPEDLDFGPFVVQEGKYFCMGDNRNYSYDCRYWNEHYISQSNIIAKVHFVITSELKFQNVSKNF